MQHALSCKKGGFVTLRHNTLRDTTAKLLSVVCHDVKVEPQLHPLTGESLEERTANHSAEARLDISARGFWTSGQKAFFDVRVFNPTAARYGKMESTKMYAKQFYNERIQNIEQRSFTPFVFSAMGGRGRECSAFYKRLSELLADKRKQPLTDVSNWVNRKIAFSLIKGVVMCVRGSRSIWIVEEPLVISLANDARDVEALSIIQ